MSTNLTITPEAGLPDRGAKGLRIDFATGNDGAYLLHDLADDAAVLHVRLMLAPATATGGAARVAGAHDAAGSPTWWLDFDADQRRVYLELATGHVIAADLNALPWHCIEAGVDTSEGVARLWIDGLEHDAVQGTFDDLASRSVWLGGVFKDTAMAGAIYADEWVMSEAYIGPVVAEPTSTYADDPRRWLVLYNAAVPDAVTWVEAYRVARGVPFANLLGLSLPTQETINTEQYSDLAGLVNGYLAGNGLGQQVMGVLVGFGVPGYVDFGFGHLDAVPSLMHSDHLDETVVGNPEVSNALPQRPRFADMAGRRMTARIDGPTLEAALTLIDRADAQIADGLGDGADAKLWFDPFAGSPGSIHTWWRQQMIDWAIGYDRQRLRLSMEVSGDLHDPDQPETGFASISHDAFFWGWPAAEAPAPPAGFFAEPAGPRVCCVQLHHSSATSTTLRSATPANWIDTALAAGYAAAIASSRSFSLSNTPHVRPFFDALRQGWTLGEAWYVSLPIQREGQHLVGDPLLRTRFPAAGWDVFGPVRQLEHLDVTTPAVALPLHATSHAMTALPEFPEDGDGAVYLVRRLDDQGRSEGGLAMTHEVRDGALFRRPAMAPILPERGGWRPLIDEGGMQLVVQWERPMRDARVRQVSLLVEADGEAEAVLFTSDLNDAVKDGLITADACAMPLHVPLPPQRARYRWRYVSDDGAVQDTPRSAWVQPVMPGDKSLTVWETQS